MGESPFRLTQYGTEEALELLLEEAELDAPTGRVADYIPDLRLATRECGRSGDFHLLHRWISGISRSVR